MIKHIFLIVTLTLCAVASFRLDGLLAPESYDVKLTFEDDFETSKIFKGYVSIVLNKVKILGKVDRIQLHVANEIKFDQENIVVTASGTKVPVNSISYNETTEIIDILLDGHVNDGDVIEFTDFTGTLYEDNYGIYLSKYEDDDGTKQVIATTQFAATFARRAFPCFDEPEFKAKFNLEIAYPTAFKSVLSNTPVLTQETGKIKFATTPVMSSYLVAFTISKFDYVEDAASATPIKVYSRPGTQTTAEYAKEVSYPLLSKLNSFANLAYNSLGIRKMDEIGIPDFAAGAMENWGLVTYRESSLLWDSAHSTTQNKQRVATVIAHEFAHQWFGNLITFKWWSDTWLNEGVARYFEYHITQQALSSADDDWELHKQFVVEQLQTIFASDSVASSMALSSDAETQSEISAKFDSITYAKGGSIVRMMEHLVGSDNFKKSFQSYITNNKHKNTEPADFFSYFSHDDIKNFSEFMSNWIYKSGYPIVTASVNGKTVTLTQEQYLYEGFSTTKWNIPISYSLSNAHNFDDTSVKTFLLADNQPATISLENEDDYVILNVQESGYYRVNYDKDTWTKIIEALKTDEFHGIGDINRAQLIDDIMNLARIGQIEYNTALDLMQYLENEVSYYPWYAGFNAIAFLTKRLSEGSLKTEIQKNALNLLQKLYDITSFDRSAIDSMKHLERLRNSLTLDWACKLGNQYCQGNATDIFNEFKANPSELVTPDLRSTVYCTGVKQSKEHWDFLWDIFTQTKVAHESSTILKALGCTDDTEILNDYLLKSLDNNIIRAQDAYSVFTAVLAGSPEGVDVALDFLIAHYEEIRTSYGSMNALISVINSVADRLTTSEQVTKFKQFVNDNRENLDDAATVADAAIEKAESNIAWTNKYISDLNCFYLKSCSDSEGGANAVTFSWIALVLPVIFSYNAFSRS